MEQWSRRIEGETNRRERIGDIPTPKGHNDQQEEPVRYRDRARERQFMGVKNLGNRGVILARKKSRMYSRVYTYMCEYVLI